MFQHICIPFPIFFMVNIPCLKVRENISRFAFTDVFAVQVKVCVGGGGGDTSNIL